MTDATPLLIGSAVAFMAGLAQGCTGFGLALVAAPCFLLVYRPTTVVPTLVLLSLLNSLLVALEARRHVRFGLVIPLALGGIVGLPLGVHTLTVVNPVLLKTCVGAFVTVFATALLTGWRRPVSDGKWASFPVGIASGFLGGSTSMGGPPVILFLTSQETPKDVFRGSIVCYFFVINCCAIALFRARGLISWPLVRQAATLVPAMLLGTCVGIRLSRVIPETLFRKIAMAAVAITGAVLFATNIRNLF